MFSLMASVQRQIHILHFTEAILVDLHSVVRMKVNPVKTCLSPLRMMCVTNVPLMCHIHFPLYVNRRLCLMDRPCFLLIMLYSHCSGTWTQGFCFSCQSNSVSSDVRRWVVKWFTGFFVRGRSERKWDREGARVRECFSQLKKAPSMFFHTQKN